MRIHSRTVLYAIITVISTFQLDSFAALRETYSEFVGRHGAIANTDTAGAWTAKLEKDLVTADPNDKIYYQAKSSVCDLYDTAGDSTTAASKRAELLGCIYAPAAIRIDAGLKLINAIERNSTDPSKLLQLSQTIDQLFASGNLGYNDANEAVRLTIMHFKSIRWKCAAGRQNAVVLRQQNRLAEADAELATTMIEAMRIADRYVHDWLTLPDFSRRQLAALNYGPDAVYYLQGEIAESLGRHYDDEHKITQALAIRSEGTKFLQALLDNYPKSRYSQQAAILTIRLMKSENMDDKQIVTYAKNIADKLIPGHAFLNLVSDMAMEYTKRPHSELLANELFATVLQLEERWFPQEFGTHINYQVCLLESSMNCIRLGSLKTVGENLRKLKQMNTLDPHLKARLKRVEEVFQQKCDTEVSFVTESAHWQPASNSSISSISSGLNKIRTLESATTPLITTKAQTSSVASYMLTVASLSSVCFGTWLMKHRFGRRSR